ncbi:MAG: YDG domain-containing protein [Burkholderiaceae bacterium]|nr:YDG domain-containing protein [Burkholderiaceae bacterium]
MRKPAARTPRTPRTTPAPRQAAPRPRAAAHPAGAPRRLAAWRRWLRWPRISRLLRRLLAVVLGSAALAWSAGPVYAQIAPGTLPGGGSVVTGQGTLAASGSTLTIVQSSARLGIDWQSFSIGRDALVEFLQPGPGSIALNRVVGHEATQIYGRLRANGQVFLTNANGVLFAPGAKVDVGGLVASTLEMSQADFAAGIDRFRAGAGGGSVVNAGELRARAGGYLALFGQTVENRGEIQVDAGSVVLASGRAATLSISGSGLLSAVVEPGVAGAVLNSGRIAADGGSVRLDASSAEAVASSLVNNSGIVRANALEERNGEIWITGDRVVHSGAASADGRGATDAGLVVMVGDMARGSLEVTGTVSARADAGRGGQVETSAATVRIDAGTRVDTRAGGGHGRWLIDPTDFTVAAGSGAPTASGIGALTLQANLELGDIELATAPGGAEPGDLFVNANVAWAASTRLTLTANRHVEINADVTATGGGASLAVNVGAGGRFEVAPGGSVRLPGPNSGFRLNGTPYVMVRSLAELQAIDGNATVLGGFYALADDIDGLGAAFNPIGNDATTALSASNSFSGRFQGLGNRVANLLIDRPTSNSAGLFASLQNADVANLELANLVVSGNQNVGTLVGTAGGSTRVQGVHASGGAASALDSTSSGVRVGGLIGAVPVSTTVSVLDSSAAVASSGRTNVGTASVGGLVGQMLSGSVADASASGAVIATISSGTNDVSYRLGGLIGDATLVSIQRSSASGAVTEGRDSGGLVGRYAPGTGNVFSDNSASGVVSGNGNAGGLVGYALGTGALVSSQATGAVSTSVPETTGLYAGGAVGHYALSGAPSGLSASGSVSGGNATGGVIGYLQTNVALAAGSIVSVVPVGGTRTVTGPRWVGGLVGYSDSTTAASGLGFSGTVTATNSAGAVGGLFGRSAGALSSSSTSGNITGVGTAGGVVGQAQGGGGFSNVTSSATVTTTGTSTNFSTGGLVGLYQHAGALVGGTATGAVSGVGSVGGLVGEASNPSGTFGITDSTASGNVTSSGTSSANTGGLVGHYLMNGAMARVRADGTVTGGDRVGGLVGYFQSGAALQDATQTGATVSLTATGTGTVFVGGLVGDSSSAAMTDVGAVADVRSTRTGTRYLGGLVGRNNGSITRGTASGDVSDEATTGTAYAGGLVGSAEGTGRTIGASSASGNVSSASTTGSGATGGLVGYASLGSIVDSRADGAVSGGLYAGGIVGFFTSTGNLDDLVATGSVSSRGDTGGIAGFAQGTGAITDSSASGNVTSSDSTNYSVGGAVGYGAMSAGVTGVTASGTVSGGGYTGGVVGYHNTTGALSAVSTTATLVTGGSWVGGIVGYSTASVIDGLAATADVVQLNTGGAAGGLAGFHSGALRNSSATGSVTGRNHAGGLVGQAQGSGAKTNLTASGSVSSTTTSSGAGVGGLIGYLTDGLLTNASASGAVSGGGYTGGLVGYYVATIAEASNLRATGSVTHTLGNTAGGLIGYVAGNGSMRDVRAEGNVNATTGTSFAGGLFGYFNKNGGLTDAHATGDVTGGSRTGGLVGYFVSSGNLGTATAAGDVSGTSYVGGLVGDFVNSGTLSNATASGNVVATQDGGGLVGSFYNSGDALNLQASGTVTAGSSAGGLFGLWQYSGTLKDSRATGAVVGDFRAGGLVGYVYDTAGIDNSSAAGAVRGRYYAGGLLGESYLTIVNRGTATGAVTAIGQSFDFVYAGGLAGYFNNSRPGATVGIFDSSATGAVRVDANNGTAGGLVGRMSGGAVQRGNAIGSVTAVDSLNPGNTGSHTAGGLIGDYNASGTNAFTDNTATGNVLSQGDAGGLVGRFQGTTTSGALRNVTATGSVQGRQTVGGLIGELDYVGVINGNATGRVQGTVGSGETGGLIGRQIAYYAGSTVESSRASGDVSGGQRSGGLIGYRYGFTGSNMGAAGISDSFATGDVDGGRYSGGLVGQYDGTHGNNDGAIDNGIRRSFASGDVRGTQYLGGLVGYFEGFGGFVTEGGVTRAAGGISDSQASGSVTLVFDTQSVLYAGGLVGLHEALSRTNATGTQLGAITRSTASGAVTLQTAAVIPGTRDFFGGGLAGFVDGPTATALSVSDSYATGAVSFLNAGGRMTVGGLVGQTDSSLVRTYATGAVQATGVPASLRIGGLVGRQTSPTATAAQSLWATDATGQAASAMGTASTLAEMRTAAPYTGWDRSASGGSTAVWRQYEGFTTPLLRALLTPLTVSVGDVAKVYDGTANLGSVPITLGGISVLEPQNIFVGGNAVDAGSYAFGPTNLYSNQAGYDLTVSGSATLTISRRPLTLAGLVADKVYDGTTAATLLAAPQLAGLVAGEDLVFVPGAGFSASFATRTAGTDKTVNISGSYSVADGTVGRAANYLLPAGLASTADILPKPVTIGGLSAVSRPYDGTTAVQVTASGTVSGVIDGDLVSFDPASVTAGTIPDRHVGTRPVTISGGLLAGADAGNYTVTGAEGLTVQITPRTLVLNGLTADNRNYNAGTSVTVRSGSSTLSGLIAGDAVLPVLDRLNGSIANKNVGDGKPVTVTGAALRGLDAANYSITPGPVTVNIAPAPLTIGLSHTGASSRVYDGTTDASTTFPRSWFFGDDITVSATSVGYADKNVAYTPGGAVTSKVITASGLAITGADASNYVLANTSATLNGTITPKPLTVSGVSATDRIYDGTRNVDVSISGATVDITAVILGDQVSVSTPPGGSVVGQMADKNVGTNKPVTVPGLALTGNDAGNYTITGGGSGVTVDIERKPVTATYTALSRVYNGGTAAGVDVTTSDFIAGDSVNFYIDDSNCGLLSCGYAVFVTPGSTLSSFTTDRHAGVDKPVLVTSNNFLIGGDANNYTLTNPRGSAGTATVTPRPVTLSFNGVTKVYDGGTTASVTLVRSSASVYSVDNVSTTQTAVYTGAGAKNVGTNKPIAISDIVFSGPDAGNYIVLNTTAASTGAVTPKPVTVSGITATNRAYDGTTTVAVTAADVGSSGFVAGDIVSVSLPPGGLSSGTIATAGVGLAKPVTVTGLSLSGADAPNYSIDSGASGITVDIFARALMPSFSAPDKVYDGSTVATVTSTTTGIVAGDAVTLQQSARFIGDGAKNVGSGKTIEVSEIRLAGSAAANYTLASTTASTTGNILPKPVTVTYVGGSRVYNGLADLSAPVVGGSLQFVAGDLVGLSQTALFTGDGGAGVAKPVSISNVALTGADAGNYLLSGAAGATTATVTPRPLTVTGVTATSRVYDGTTTVDVNVSGATVDTASVIPGDQVGIVLPPSGISTGTMADRFVGNAKPVTISGASLSGAASANYVLVGASGLTVNIAPRPLNAVYGALDKVYDGSASATVTGAAADLLAIDAGGVGISASGVFTGGKSVGIDKAVAISGGFLTGTLAGNYTLVNSSGAATADITPRTLSVSYGGITKVYDGLDGVSVTGSLTGRLAGDVVGTTQTARFTGPGAKNVGNGKPVEVSGIALTGADAGNYQLAGDSVNTSGSITPRPITISGLDAVTAVDRVYDGTTSVVVQVPDGVTLTPVSSDILPGDIVGIALPGAGLTTGTMADRHVGQGKPVAITGLTLDGADAGNYFITGTAGVTVDISPLALTAVWSGVNRVYDGTTAAQASGSAAALIAGDNVLIRGSGVFSDGKNVGTAKPVSITSALLSGSEARNYLLLNTTGSTTADVTRRTVTPGYASVTKVYDGSVDAPVVAAFGGFIAGDAVAATQTAVFTGPGARNVGTGKTVSITDIALTGADAGNYLLGATTATTSGSITPRPLTLTGLTGVSAVDRVYDGTTSVAVQISGNGPIGIDPAAVVPGDDVGVSNIVGNSTTGTMANKNAGVAKPVVVDGLALTGADAGNYRVTATQGVTVTITPRLLTASYIGVDKVYDGTATASVLGSSADILAGDTVTIGGSAVFSAGRNAGTDLAIAVTAGLLGGSDALNYLLTNPTGSASADILPKTVTALYSGGTRVYDGTVLAPVLGQIDGLITGDAVSLSQSAVFTGPGARNAGTGKAVAVSGIALNGSDAANYRLAAQTASTTATVTPRPLRIIGLTGVTAADRVYDGTREVQVTVTTTGPITPEPGDLIPGDDVTLTAPPAGATTGLMVDKHVGSNKPVAVAGLTIGGADAANYSVAETAGVTVSITPRPLAPTFVGISRVYDGTTAASIGGFSPDILAGDTVLIIGSGLFTGDGARNAGLNKSIAVTSALLGGADGQNYLLTTTTGSATADITPRTLSTAYTGVDRVYDGSTAATVTRTLSNLVTGDDVGVSESASFTDGRNVGSNKPVLVSGITLTGADAGNYRVAAPTALTTANVTPRLLTVSGLTGLTATDRVYDGTLDVNVSLAPGGGGTVTAGNVVPGDDVLLSFTGGGGARMLDKNAGQAKPVTLTGLTLAGADAGNYLVGGVAGLTVNIAPRPVTLAGVTAVDRVYDGTTLVSIDRSGATITGAIAGDLLEVSASATGTLPDKGVGSNRPVSVAGLALAGADAGNYVVVDSAPITVNIARRDVSAVFAGVDREYDGTTNALLSITTSGLVTGDAIALTATGTFTGPGARNAGAAKPISITEVLLSGADAGNYRLLTVGGSATASILPRLLSAGVTVAPRVYDGTTTASVSLVSSGVVDGDAVTLSGTATYTGDRAKDVGNDKPVTVAGLTLGGADAGNYTLGGLGSLVTTGSIRPRLLALSFGVLDKVYDGDTGASVSVDSDRIAGDELVVSASGARFATADAGSGLRVDIAGLALAGADAGNYQLPGALPLVTGTIRPAPLTITAATLEKLYGTELVAPPGTAFSASGLVAGQTVGTVSLASDGFGALQPVAGSPYALVPSAAGGGSFNPANYDIRYENGAVIVRPRPLTVSSDFVVAFENTLEGLSFGATITGLLPGLGHAVGGLVAPAPDLRNASGGSRITLLHSGGSISGTDPRNYELRYEAGRLLVLPRPAVIGDVPEVGGGGFGVSFTPEEVAAAAAALEEAVRMLNAPAAGDGSVGPGLRVSASAEAGRAAAALATLSPEDLAALFGTDPRQITLPALQRLQLISLDPALRRLLGGAAAR